MIATALAFAAGILAAPVVHCSAWIIARLWRWNRRRRYNSAVRILAKHVVAKAQGVRQ